MNEYRMNASESRVSSSQVFESTAFERFRKRANLTLVTEAALYQG
uniref:Uncharacterized protein n=1 Tax=Anguilla anguilla TaxID=7936 RepID=A0A0E9PLJ0_ANGAN